MLVNSLAEIESTAKCKRIDVVAPVSADTQRVDVRQFIQCPDLKTRIVTEVAVIGTFYGCA